MQCPSVNSRLWQASNPGNHSKTAQEGILLHRFAKRSQTEKNKWLLLASTASTTPDIDCIKYLDRLILPAWLLGSAIGYAKLSYRNVVEGYSLLGRKSILVARWGDLGLPKRAIWLAKNGYYLPTHPNPRCESMLDYGGWRRPRGFFLVADQSSPARVSK